MPSLFACVALSAMFVVVAPHRLLAPSVINAINATEKTVPQGTEPPGAGNEDQESLSAPQHKDVIAPPPIGDEDIYTDVPNPEAGHEEEVIPPPDISR